MDWTDKIKVTNEDCMDLMARYPDNHFDLAIVDPPYGISINMNMGLKKNKRKRHVSKNWDNSIPDDSYFHELRRVSKNQIIWGGNYFNLGASLHYIFWDKLTPEGMSFSDGELAWTSFDRAIKKVTKRNVTGDKIHPTQKPLFLYEWLLMNYAQPSDLILDTHLGSGTHALACHNLGFKLTACELDQDYYEASYKKFNMKISQTRMF